MGVGSERSRGSSAPVGGPGLFHTLEGRVGWGGEFSFRPGAHLTLFVSHVGEKQGQKDRWEDCTWALWSPNADLRPYANQGVSWHPRFSKLVQWYPCASRPLVGPLGLHASRFPPFQAGLNQR